MTLKIAIQHDFVRQKNGKEQSFSDRWKELARKHGVSAVPVDAYAGDLFERLRECDGFMWRFGFDALSLQYAKRLLPAIEHGMGLPVFPSWSSHWHFEDKIAQRYLLTAAGIPMPRTWVLWKREEATQFCDEAQYPLVAKLSSGFQSNNVRLLKSRDEAADLIRLMFGPGLHTMARPPGVQHLLRHRMRGLKLLAGRPLPRGQQHGYLYVQEFLPGNAFDTRVTVIGDRAFAYRRRNRPGDFRASGSGLPDWDVSQIDEATVRLAFRVARTLNTQSVAIDGLRRGEERVVGEISYTYVSWMVAECPGHWRLRGEPATGELVWIDGNLRPEDAIFDDFVASVQRRGRAMAA